LKPLLDAYREGWLLLAVPLSRRRFLRHVVEVCVALSGLAAIGCVSQRSGTSTRATKIPLVGILGSAPPRLFRAFQEGLRDLGYIEGQTIRLERRVTEGQNEPLDRLARELVEARVDVLVAGGSQAVQAARNATSTIPVVMAFSGDAVVSGLVRSLARPGGNVTGLTISSYQLNSKRLELLQEMIPGVSRVAIFLNPNNPSHPAVLRSFRQAGASLGVRLQPFDVRPQEDFQNAFAGAVEASVQAVIVLGDQLTLAHQPQIAALATERRLPGMYTVRDFVEAGGLVAYGPSLPAMFRRAASYVDKILKGASPQDLPVEQPALFELVINLKTARAIGLTIPPSLVARADEVIP
jgi:putative ABC transport system substrate-binding protein